MDLVYMIRELRIGLGTIQALLSEMTQDEALIRPDPKSWSSLEVLSHLVDEEREDFRMHIGQIFSSSDKKWHAIDPEGWVLERQYQAQSLKNKLAEFISERDKSIHWLQNLRAADWTATIPAPFGDISAKSLLAAWADHDNLHMRQLVEIRHYILSTKCASESTRYAGDW